MMTQTTNLKLNMFDASDKFNNDALNENWQKIDDGVSLTGSAEGTNIQITDASNNCGLYSLYIEGESSQNGTPSSDNPIDIESIGDSGSLSVTAMTGNQLASLPDIDGVTNNGVTWTCKDGVVTAKGTSTLISSSTAFLAHYMPTGTVGTFYVSGGNNKVAVFMYIKYANGTSNYIYNNSFVLDGTEQTVRLYLQVEAGVTVDDTIYPMLNKGNTALPFESYKGNTATITTSLPLCAVGGVKDELIFNADGTAKIIKRLRKIILKGAENWVIQNKYFLGYIGNLSARLNPSQFLSSIGGVSYATLDGNGYGLAVYYGIRIKLESVNPQNSTVAELKTYLANNPITVIQPLATPEEINLTAEETAALLSLETFEGLTNVFNSDNAQMSVEYWRNEDVGSLLTSISRSTNSRLTALENAILGG